MPFYDQPLLKHQPRALPSLAAWSALLVGPYMLLQLARHGRPPYTDYRPIFLAATVGCTLLVFGLRCAYALLQAFRRR